MINQDLKRTCEINQTPYSIKSHSFRINMITQLLKNTSVQNAADILGHKDIKATMAYKRYALNKKEIQKLLNKIDQDY
jgi:integrase